MKFLFPSFLFALFSIVIPILIHLFNFRRFKKVYFSDIRFLNLVQVESEKKSKLKHLLILICRILFVICLVVAFSQPYIPNSDSIISKEGNAIGIYIDNSFSAKASTKNGVLLETIKDKAKEIVQAYKLTDDFVLLTNNFESKYQRLITKDEMLLAIDEVDFSPMTKSIANINKRIVELIKISKKPVKNIFYLSDFQKAFFDIESLNSDSLNNHFLLPLQGNNNSNLSIDSCWLGTPYIQLNQQQSILFSVKNHASVNVEKIPIRLYINNVQKAITNIDIAANETKIVSLPFQLTKNGINNGYIELIDYPIVFDDKMFFSFKVEERIPLLVVNQKDENKYINKLFIGDSLVKLNNKNLNNLSFADIFNNKVVFLNEVSQLTSGFAAQLQKFVADGGYLVIIPNKTGDLTETNLFLKSLNAPFYSRIDTLKNRLSKINFDAQLYKDVFEKVVENADLPIINKRYLITKNMNSSDEWLLQDDNANKLLTNYDYKKGKIFIFSFPFDLSFSSFLKHPLFVVTLYKLVLQSQIYKQLYNDISVSSFVINGTLSNSDTHYVIINDDGSNEFIPEQRISGNNTYIYPRNLINTAGNFYLKMNNEILHGISFNYNRKESSQDFLNAELLQKSVLKNDKIKFKIIKESTGSLQKTIESIAEGVKLWKFFIILALCFLLFEILLIRFYK